MTMIMPTAVRIASQPAAPQQTTSAKPHRSRRPQHQARSTTTRTTTARGVTRRPSARAANRHIQPKRQLHYSGLDVIVLGRRCHNNSRRKVHHGREPLVQSVDRLALLRHSNNGPAHVGLTPQPSTQRPSVDQQPSQHPSMTMTDRINAADPRRRPAGKRQLGFLSRLAATHHNTEMKNRRRLNHNVRHELRRVLKSAPPPTERHPLRRLKIQRPPQ